MKLQLDRDIAYEMDWAIDSHINKGGRTIKRIDLDEFEFRLFLDEVVRLIKDGYAKTSFDILEQRTKYYYKGIEIVQR